LLVLVVFDNEHFIGVDIVELLVDVTVLVHHVLNQLLDVFDPDVLKELDYRRVYLLSSHTHPPPHTHTHRWTDIGVKESTNALDGSHKVRCWQFERGKCETQGSTEKAGKREELKERDRASVSACARAG